ncbi:MAG: hypothetical protein A2931_03130 [Candidatus Niyogibacteria bacterium RIFCSPLOWO2_01_FULL_45_48]|uniref:Uncharacterized protein n=2 Tax=Candidatus Niyogiibacteriota TaxID=1817912 RepID=A0A1G2EX83_9BACT|nr:MAG: hypothetical protein A2835_03390 [Candidatus Niyogibacteria bacterium RIFCSPHIGHO2_01_FULL_45_28]OGZ30426.1 MAG: hypothetical protein A3J00_04105 [Candidatus Niyogibacteria bacterium RIFCSPLOWO2_02_FULL_45_13]OGZ31337.1 MAG: hypothetical protein A2931_03130 [Candidatus Niyogibacteria bacterium RIFCSPLOWO2_01_FULL_45_48]
MMRFESTMPMREGRINEVFLVGRPKFKKETPPEIKRALETRGQEKTGQLFGYVEKYFDGDPTNPERKFLKDLRGEVALELGFVKPEDQKRLKAFPVVGTELDRRGADFFFSVDIPGKDKALRIVGDVTSAPEHEKTKRGEGLMEKVIIYGDIADAEMEGKEAYQKTLQKYAGEFIKMAKEKSAPPQKSETSAEKAA